MYSGQIGHEEKTEYNPNPMEVPPDETWTLYTNRTSVEAQQNMNMRKENEQHSVVQLSDHLPW